MVKTIREKDARRDTRATVVPIAISFARRYFPPLSSPPLLQSSRVLVCFVPPGTLALLRYLFVFCTASLQPQTSPSPPTPCSSSFFFLFFHGFSLLVVRSPPRSLSSSRFINLPGPPDQLFFLPVTVQISIPETPRGRWGCGPFICAHQCLSREYRGIRLNVCRHWASLTLIQLQIIYLYFLYHGLRLNFYYKSTIYRNVPQNDNPCRCSQRIKTYIFFLT